MSGDNPTPLLREDILSWPKAELHCHLDGSVRPSTLLDLAADQGKTDVLPGAHLEGLLEALEAVDLSDNLEDYLAWFRYSVAVMQSQEALSRTAYELAEDNAAENVRYLEVRYAPILHMAEGLSVEAVNEAIWDGLSRAQRDHGITSRLIIIGLRDRPESVSLMQAEMAVESRDSGVVAFDLAGGEAGNPSKEHLTAFYHARNNLLSLTIHAGESWGPDSIRQAVFYCGAHRIGHGTTLHQDPDLMTYFVDHQIPLEICPTSNVQTKVVESLEAHPISTFVAAGVPVTVNTDNRLFSRTSVTEELWRAHTRCGIGAHDLREIVLNGFRYAFLEWQDRQDLLRDVLDEFPVPSSPRTPIW